jgi:hypothetical protein
MPIQSGVCWKPCMKSRLKFLFLVFVLLALPVLNGCVSCLPQYTAPPTAPPSACYPSGHDPYVPMDHNPTPLNPWDLFSSITAPFMYGPPR